MARTLAEAIFGGIAQGGQFAAQNLIPYVHYKQARQDDQERENRDYMLRLRSQLFGEKNADRQYGLEKDRFDRGVFESDRGYGFDREQFDFRKSESAMDRFYRLLSDNADRDFRERSFGLDKQRFGLDERRVATDEALANLRANQDARKGAMGVYSPEIINTLLRGATEGYFSRLPSNSTPDYNFIGNLPNMMFGSMGAQMPRDTSGTGGMQIDSALMKDPDVQYLLKRGWTIERIMQELGIKGK